MSAIMDVFKIKPFDLEPIYDSWPSAPIFQGNLARDPPVDDWLKQIKEGSIARGVPKEYWHKVAQHYLGPRAKFRFDELKAVMKNMHGGRYSWNWKRFKIAMRNMGWEIEEYKTEEIKVRSKPSGLWWIVGGRGREPSESGSDLNASTTSFATTSATSSVHKDISSVPPSAWASSDAGSTRPTPRKSMSWDMPSFKGFPRPKRSTTMNSDTMSTFSTDTGSETVVSSSGSTSEKSKGSPASSGFFGTPVTSPEPTPASTPGESTTATASVPTWLLNATQALSFLATENPKTMTAISAILITVGSIPNIPALAAGAGGAFLASGTAHAIGSIAVGVGSLLKAVSDGQQAKPADPQAQPQPRAHPQTKQ